MATGQVVFLGLVSPVPLRTALLMVLPAIMPLAGAKDVSRGNTQISEMFPHSDGRIPKHYVPTQCSHLPAELSHSCYIVLDREANLA